MKHDDKITISCNSELKLLVALKYGSSRHIFAELLETAMMGFVGVDTDGDALKKKIEYHEQTLKKIREKQAKQLKKDEEDKKRIASEIIKASNVQLNHTVTKTRLSDLNKKLHSPLKLKAYEKLVGVVYE